jgi:PAS domain S-box-containing protein
MLNRTSNLEEFLESILRGAAKILGCNSTNLILFNERTGEIRVHIGAMAVSYPVLDNIEQLLGKSFKGISVPIERAQDSMVYRSWRDRIICETSSLSELVGGTFQLDVTEQMSLLAGEHRFICVPALSGSRNYGVLLFTKEGKHPFNRQQLEVLLRYARRIGEIVERQGQDLFAHPFSDGLAFLLFDSHCNLVGHGPETLGGLHDTPSLIGPIKNHAKAILTGDGDSTFELSTDCRVTFFPLALDQGPGVLCEVRKRGLHPGVSLENQLLQLTLGDPAPTLFVDPDYCITSCNEATEQLFGYSSAELLHQPVAKLFREPQEILFILSQQVLDPATLYSEESTNILCKDGAIRPVKVEILFLADDENQVVGFLVMVRDVAESEMGDRDRLLVQERLATMGELATQLAHEIRNPLLAIGATLNSLSMEDLADEHRQILATLGQEIARMDMTLRDYLAARHDISSSSVNLAEVVDDVRRLLEGAHRTANKTIRNEIEPSLTVMADYDAIKHVFFNLLLNALEASPPEASVVTCRASVGEHDVSVLIEDEGPGLGEDAERCFLPFFTTKKNGTGLGLAVCQKIARAHGGLVELKNREEGGCLASVILPRRGGGEWTL